MGTNESEIAQNQQFYLNGVDALTGGPLWPPQSPEQVVERAMAEFDATPTEEREELRDLSALRLQANFGMDVDHLDDPAEARWGVIVPAGDTNLRAALQPLIDHRAARLGFQPKVFEVDPGTNAVAFLRANGVDRGLGVVEKVPYYLLIAGDPQQISFRFQVELSTEYATGRLHFDTPDGYAAYAEHLVNYERAISLPNRREAVFWAPERPVDPATSRSAPYLVQPLYDQLKPGLKFDKRLYRGDQDDGTVKPATRTNLRSILAGSRLPAMLFTASHGMGYKKPYPGQAEQQGALVCQEYTWGEAIERNQWYGAEDLIQDGADVRGLLHFAFACFGAGTPQYDDYGDPDQPAPAIANQPFIAALPRQMLARGALAFIGHVERAWDYSFMATQPLLMPGVVTPLVAFERAIDRILRGLPIAYSLRDEYDRGIHLSTSLLETIASRRHGAPIPAVTLARLWTERNDARAYMLIGDPAARLRVDLLGQDGDPVVVPGATLPAQPSPPAAPLATTNSSPAATNPGPNEQNPATTPNLTPTPVVQPADKSGTTTPNEGNDQAAGNSFLPVQTTGRDPQIDRELLEAWRDYIKNGFKQNNTMFQRVLSAFMVPYWLTVVMYGLLFIVGLGGFIVAAVLMVQQQIGFAAIFGGLSVVAFLTFFISGPLRSLEQNLIFITWLGIIYNTYWSQLMNATDPQNIRQDLETITTTALKDLDQLADKHGKLAAQRPGLSGTSTSPAANPAQQP